MRLQGWVFKSELVNESIITMMVRDKTGSSYWCPALSNAATFAVRRPDTAYRVFDTFRMPINIHQVFPFQRSHLGFRPSVSLGFASPNSAPRPCVGLASLSHGHLNWIRFSGIAPLAFVYENCNVTKARHSCTITQIPTTQTELCQCTTPRVRSLHPVLRRN